MSSLLLAGNPNVGKSTVFNHLTGENVHTGNWIGKTVETAKGEFTFLDQSFEIFDLPGTYSLNAHSNEEEVARDAILFMEYDLIVVVVDASSLERNLNLVLQILEYTNRIILCVNLVDEALKKGTVIDKDKLESLLGIRVILTSARSGEGMDDLKHAIYEGSLIDSTSSFIFSYSEAEDAISLIANYLEEHYLVGGCSRFLAKSLLLDDEEFVSRLFNKFFIDVFGDKKLQELLFFIRNELAITGYTKASILESVVSDFSNYQKKLSLEVIKTRIVKKKFDWDFILTSKMFGIPIMILMLGVVFWITIVLSNYPSSLLSAFFGKVESLLVFIFSVLHIPNVVTSCLIYGIFRTLSWVISVMAPPMIIFFPLFSLLEDLGYLPRVAFNLDGIFKKCGACGKQALTMMMGFGCNAVGATGSRIIDSKKMRLISILTNSFVPCNGRFPMLILLISMFLVGSGTGILEVFYLVLFILLSCFMTFFISLLLSKFILREKDVSFTLELPPFRRPEVGKVIYRSLKDKALLVLKRAIVVSIPAGFLIWVLANIQINGLSILLHVMHFFDSFGRSIGLDGVILTSFLLGFPANEIVIPIMIMAYTQTGVMEDFTSVMELKNLFILNGWSITTCICTCIFSLFHFPCSTTVLTIYHETKSVKWTIFSILLPLVVGVVLCFLVKSFITFFL